MTRLAFPLTCSLLLMLSLTACPGATTAPSGPTDAATVIDAYIEAIGGKEAIEQVRTMKIYATYEEPAYNLVTPTLLYKKRPDFRVVELPNLMIAEGYMDGASWEYHGAQNSIVWTDGEAEKATRRGAEFDESVVDWKEKGHEVTLGESIELFDRATWGVQVTLADGWAKTYYFDQQTGLIVARKKAMPIHAVGEDVETLSRIEDYRQIGNLKIPFVETEFRIDDGTMLNRLRIDEVLINVPLPDEMFTPEATRKRLQETQ